MITSWGGLKIVADPTVPPGVVIFRSDVDERPAFAFETAQHVRERVRAAKAELERPAVPAGALDVWDLTNGPARHLGRLRLLG